MEKYDITGMSCAACSARVEKAVSKLDGVEECSVNLLTNSMAVKGSASSDEIIKAVENAGYGASLHTGNASPEHKDSSDEIKDTETPKMVKRLVFSVLLLLPLMYLSMGHTMWGWPVPAFFRRDQRSPVPRQRARRESRSTSRTGRSSETRRQSEKKTMRRRFGRRDTRSRMKDQPDR